MRINQAKHSYSNREREMRRTTRIAPIAAAIAAVLAAPVCGAAHYDQEVQVAGPTSGPYVTTYDDFHYGTELGGAAGNTLLYWDDDNPYATTTWGRELVVRKLDNFEADNVIDVEVRKLNFTGVDSLSAGMNMILFKVEDLNGNTLRLASTSAPYTLGTVLQGTGTVSLAKTYVANPSDDSVKYTIASVSSASSGKAPGGSSGSSGAIHSTAGLGLAVQPQTRAASLAMSAATVAGQASASNAETAIERLALSGIYGIQSFGAIGGGFARQEFGGGERIDLSNFNLAVGIGNRMKLAGSTELAFGGFLETGFGSFENHYDAGIAEGKIDKKGHVRFVGAGFGARALTAGGWHFDGAIRAGNMKSKQNSAFYSAALDAASGFEISVPYYGAQAGIGRIVPAGDKAGVDIHASASWLHVNSEDLEVMGDSYKLDSVDSAVLKAGAKYERHVSDSSVIYAGGGWQQQLGGKADLKVRASGDDVWYSAGSSEVKGGSAYAELGFKSNPKGGLHIDIALGGYAGSDARGASARAQALYMF